MKLTKMSLVAALLVAGTSAFAIENVKVSGDAKLYYSTNDQGNVDLFNKAGAAGQASASLSISADLVKNVSAGTKVTALSTLGLQNNLVSNVWEQADGLNDTFIVNEAWIAGTVGKTTGKIGRMELDTPLVFTETWSIVANTFEAAVVINQDLPDTTLVGAYVGGSNGSDILGTNQNAGFAGVLTDAQQVDATGANTTFQSFYQGAYAAGAVNNSFKPLTVQAWYYQLQSVGKAYWLQADLKMDGILAGAQYTSGKVGNGDWSGTYALMLGYEMKDMLTAKVSYSQTSDKTTLLNGENVGSATNYSKLYTNPWWNYGYITRKDTSAYNVTIESPVNGMFDLGVYYTAASVDSAANQDLSEVTVTAGKKFGPLDTTLVYVYTDAEDQNAGDTYNTIQAYLTLNF